MFNVGDIIGHADYPKWRGVVHEIKDDRFNFRCLVGLSGSRYRDVNQVFDFRRWSSDYHLIESMVEDKGTYIPDYLFQRETDV